VKKYSQIIEQFAADSVKPNPLGYNREKYLKGDMFKVGDIVECASGTAEILSLGTNYVTLIREGKTFKSWISDIHISKIKLVEKSASGFQYKGYSTKNLPKSIIEEFKGIEVSYSDSFAMFNCIVSCDKLFGVTEASIQEDFGKYKREFDKTNRYLKKFKIKLDEISSIEDALLEYAILNDVSFCADKLKIANAIVVALGGSLDEGCSLSDMINSSVTEFKNRRNPDEAWKLAGSMLNRASDSGISWDKDILKQSTRKIMGIR
jgi:hypothetical protein